MLQTVERPATSADHVVRRERLPALTSLRFFAALVVVLRHFRLILAFPAPFNPILDEGRLGVNFFFVLSGFVLAYNYLDWFSEGIGRAGKFFWQRVARIYPVAMLALVLITPVSLVSVWRPDDIAASLSRPTLAASWLMNLLQLEALWPRPPAVSVWNVPAWSISAEMAFYATFPLFALFVLWPCIRARRLGWLFLALFVAQLGLLAAAEPLGRGRALVPGLDFRGFDEFAYISPIFRVWEFFLGATLGGALLYARQGGGAALLGRLRSSRAARDAALIAVPIALLAVFGIPRLLGWQTVEHYGSWKWYALPTPVWLLLIATLASGATFATRLLEKPWLVFLGDASYALYVLHWVPVSVVLTLEASGYRVPTPVILALLAGTFAAASLSYRFIEVPSRRWLRRLSLRPLLVRLRPAPPLTPEGSRAEG